jgi:hypothetical protein
MSDDPRAVPRLVSINRQQLVLRSMDVEKLVETWGQTGRFLVFETWGQTGRFLVFETWGQTGRFLAFCHFHTLPQSYQIS